MNLMDADRACECLAKDAIKESSDKEKFMQIMYAQSFIECFDKIDAVPVVRCHSCLYYISDFSLDGNIRCLCKLTRGVVTDNDFCSRGVKKE